MTPGVVRNTAIAIVSTSIVTTSTTGGIYTPAGAVRIQYKGRITRQNAVPQ